MRVIALENNVVVDVFICDISYMEKRKKDNINITFIESEYGFIGQIKCECSLRYKVLDSMNILECNNGFGWIVGTAKDGTKLGDYEDITNIIKPNPPPEPSKPTIEEQLQEVKLSNKMQEVKLELINDALVEGGLL